MIAVVEPKCIAILGRLGKKLFIAKIEMLAKSTSVNILGWVLRSKKRDLGKSTITCRYVI